MNSEFSYLYRQLSGKSVYDVMNSVPEGQELLNIAELMDDSHIIVLNALVEEFKKQGCRDEKSFWINVGPWDQVYEMFNKDVNDSISRVRERLDEFTTVWSSKYAYGELFPQLEENGWIKKNNGWFSLAGRGTSLEARTFYKQFTHDMITECLRILALFNGMLMKNQEKAAECWQGEASEDNSLKLLPLLEVSLREKEYEKLKVLREKLSSKLSFLFINKICNWEGRYYKSEIDLFENIAETWFDSQKYSSGMEGFMFFTADFIWQLINVTGNMFHKKWRLFLRGIKRSSLTKAAV